MAKTACRACLGTGKNPVHWHGHEPAEADDEPDRLIGGVWFWPCESCYGLGWTVTTQQPRLIRQRVAKAVYAKLSARGETVFQVLERLNRKLGIEELPITRGQIDRALTGTGCPFLVFPDGLLIRTAREVMRDV